MCIGYLVNVGGMSLWITVSGAGKCSINGCRIGLNCMWLNISQFSSLLTLCHLLRGRRKMKLCVGTSRVKSGRWLSEELMELLAVV